MTLQDIVESDQSDEVVDEMLEAFELSLRPGAAKRQYRGGQARA